ncbi:MAG: KEOPS complex kinase/ATPase Bud32 [Candidatus Micrarchaeota archaeon]|nr:KEOPS complex kinase/ATPase Bud32 [Candidatus Micrarchaeota archaeon]
MKGAEAVISPATFAGLPAVQKTRLQKKYRNPQLDSSIRKSRTRREARLLAKAKEAGVLCPTVYHVSDYSICMKRLAGRMLNSCPGRISRRHVVEAARILAKLHSLDIIHGDYTPANLMLTRQGMAVIDFGLGFISCDPEDKATDVLVMKKSLGQQGKDFAQIYAKLGGSKEAARLVLEIEKRARYMERG